MSQNDPIIADAVAAGAKGSSSLFRTRRVRLEPTWIGLVGGPFDLEMKSLSVAPVKRRMPN